MPQVKDLCVINVIKRDKCGVASPQKTISNYLIENPKTLSPKTYMMNVYDLEKAKVEKSIVLVNSHPKRVKRIRRLPLSMRKKIKEYG